MPEITDFNEYVKYLPYASPRQQQVVELLLKHKTVSQVVAILKCSRQNIHATLQRLKQTADKQGFNEELGLNHPNIYATSTLVKGTEEDPFALKWIKAKTPQEQRVQQVLNILESYEYTPLPIIPPPTKKQADTLATLYTLTDFHLGMYSYPGETGEKWSTAIGAKVMLNALQDMVQSSPDAALGILNIQGDFLHWDGLDAVTPSSGHVLDADTRFDRMIELAIDLVAWAVQMLLQKHKKVRVIICEGNHDMAGSAWLRKCIKKLMVDNTRVEVDDTAIPFYAMLHGEIMLAFHHGHKVKNRSLPALFSSEAKYRQMWGQAAYTYIHTGHYHHQEQDMSESGGAIVERHPTLAARDAYAARGGYISRRGAHAITYHKTLGEVSRNTVLPRTD